jgi:predicted small lipoprotein YifL
VQRRLGIDDDPAAARKDQLEQTARALAVDVDHIGLQPAIDGGFDARQHGRGQAVVLGIGQGRGLHRIVGMTSVRKPSVAAPRSTPTRAGLRRVAPSVMLAAMLAACGQKGPLTLAAPAPSASAASAAAAPR